MSDALRIMCPSLNCRKILAIPESARGKTVRCRNCGTNIRIPANTPAPVPAGAAPAAAAAPAGAAGAPPHPTPVGGAGVGAAPTKKYAPRGLRGGRL